MTGSFPCRRCGAAIAVPPEALRDATASLTCVQCGQRYARKGSTGTLQKPAASAAGYTVPPIAPGASVPRPAAAAASGSPTEGSVPLPMALAPTHGLAGISSLREATFLEGDQVAERYRIVRFIARGGMGEVYEAQDLELRGRVALKTIHPAVADEPGAVERFKREIQLARAVTHPNVCRIFDVGYHPGGPGRLPIVFLTMELLEGETLAARLKRSGPLSTEEALPLTGQLCEALAAAHAAGVVHRDFKSENIFLVPGAAGERAVVTDFGIARAGDERHGHNLTSTGSVIGTPAYMAPEQIQGGTIGPPVDQYALGVVLFELVTGELPFRGDNPLATAARRLTEPPPSPRIYAPELDPVWEATILRCLEREPERRFADVRAVARALAGEHHGAGASSSELDQRSQRVGLSARPPAERRRRALAAVLLLVLAAASTWAFFRVREIRTRLDAAAPVAARRAVAVLALRNLAGRADASWLSTALSEMLSTELGRGDELRIIAGENVARALAELSLTGVDSLGTEARGRLRKRLGADFLVLGSYTLLADGDGLRLDLRLEDVRSSETVASLGENGTSAQLFELVARSGSALREALGASAASSAASQPVLPTSTEAARLYSEGLEALRSFAPQRGRELLERAVAADPGNALARSALATAWTALGYSAKAEEEARRARELAAGLPAEERLVVEARYFEAARSWGEAATIWEKLWSAYPDTGAYGLRVAACRTLSGQPEQALAAALALRNLPAPESEDPRIDLAEANAAGAMSDFRRQADAAARAVARAEADGAKLLAAEALVAQGWALRNLGRGVEARAVIQRGRAVYDEVGDRAGVSSADAALGGVLLDLGEPVNARAAYELALQTARDLGDRGSEARALNNLAVLARSRGELEAARASYEQVLAISAETGEQIGAAFAANNLAAILAELGELVAAEQRVDEALAIWRRGGDKSGLASALGNLGSIRRRQGRLDEAERAYGESLELRRSTGQRPGEPPALSGLAQTRLERGDLAAAGARFTEAADLARELSAKSALAAARAGQGELAALAGDPAVARVAFTEALALRRELGERAGVARLRSALVRLDLEANPATAALSAQEILAAATAERTPEVEAAARIVLARALLATGDLAGAVDALAVRDLVERLPLAQRFDWRLAAARVDLRQGRVAAARSAAAAVRQEAATLGFGVAALEAELVELEASGGDRAGLAARARAAGLGELARRAEAPGRR